MPTYGNGRRVAIVAGVRTPFARSGTSLKDYSAIDLGRFAVAELVQRTGIDGAAVDLLVFGTVVHSVVAPNLAREVALLPHFPRTLQAYTVSRACASANQAITDAADQIALGHADIAIAGGSESLSQVPILHSRGMSDVLVAASRARSLSQRVATLARVRPKDFVPITPAIAEPSTGETMGQSADKMAKINGIAREAQDRLALRSHQHAACRAGARRRSAVGGDRAGAGAARLYRHAGHRQWRAAGLHVRPAGVTPAGVRSTVRHGYRRQRVPAHRWRGRRPAHERRHGAGAGVRAGGVHPVVRLCGGRPR